MSQPNRPNPKPIEERCRTGHRRGYTRPNRGFARWSPRGSRPQRFGEILAWAAWARGFAAAGRKAFVADGASANWTIHKQWFSDYVAILDFIHALSYVFAAAMAGQGFRTGWEAYTAWIQQVWSGRVEEVIAALEVRQSELGAPEEADGETSPRRVVAEALTYLRNNKDRMRYDEYRKAGLPITSSHMESTVKMFNRRVKGTEKFWSEEGAEAILQLRADHLSETEPLTDVLGEQASDGDGATALSTLGLSKRDYIPGRPPPFPERRNASQGGRRPEVRTPTVASAGRSKKHEFTLSVDPRSNRCFHQLRAGVGVGPYETCSSGISEARTPHPDPPPEGGRNRKVFAPGVFLSFIGIVLKGRQATALHEGRAAETGSPRALRLRPRGFILTTRS